MSPLYSYRRYESAAPWFLSWPANRAVTGAGHWRTRAFCKLWNMLGPIDWYKT